MIQDNHHRIHDYLRISLTDHCNLRCFYCMPEEEYLFMANKKLMQVDEIMHIAQIFVELGVKKIRLTGGEPLVRKEAGFIMQALSSLPVELTMTTNGIRINEHLPAILASSIRSVNISLDTLHPEKFAMLTKRNLFEQVWQNIILCINHHRHVKINVVVMKGVNEDEILDFVALTKEWPVHVRFIEFMPFDGNQWHSEKVFDLSAILAKISEHYTFTPLINQKHETAKKFYIDGHKGSFAIISTMSAHFCGDCNRLRLTADGKFKNCLFSKNEVDLLTAYRSGEDIVPLIHQHIKEKSAYLGGQFEQNHTMIDADRLVNRSMIGIGG